MIRQWVLATALLCGVVAAPIGHAVAQGADPAAPVSECARTNRSVQVQMVIDESSSLIRSDPNGRREQLVGQWIEDLTALAVSGYAVDLAIAGYGSQWRPIVDWVRLDGNSAPQAIDAIGRLTKSEADTDHALALIRANESLDARADTVEDQGGVACPTILWFTDGGYDFGSESDDYRRSLGLPLTTPYSDLPVNDDNEDRIKVAGIERMCGPTGVVRSLRSKNTDIVSVALNPELDFRLVQELTDGGGYPDDDAGPGCRLGHYEGGVFTVTTNEVSTTTTTTTTSLPNETTPSTTEAPPCDSSIGCLERSEFEAPALTDQIRISVRTAPGDDVRSLSLQSPAGESISASDVAAGTTELTAGGFDVELVALSQNAVLAVVRSSDPGALAGPWTAAVGTAEPAETAVLDVAFSSTLVPRLIGEPRIEPGSPATVDIEVVDDSGAVADSQQVGLDPVVLPSGEELEWERTENGFQISLPQSATSSDLEAIDLRPRVRSEPESDLTFEDVSIPIPIVRPEYPTIVFRDVVDGVVRPDVIDTPADVEIRYSVVGPVRGEGCVTGTTESVSNAEGDRAPVGYGTPTEICLTPGEEVERVVTVAFTNRVDGRFCGPITFELTGTEALEARTTDQALCIRAERGPTAWTRLAAVLFALASLLPLALLGVWNKIAGRLPGENELTVATPPVSLHDGRLATPGGQALLTDETFTTPSYDGWRLPLLGGVCEIRSVAVMPPARGSRLRLLSFATLLGGPRNYLVPTTEGVEIVVGSRGDRIHAGRLDEPLRLPRDVDGIWMLRADDTASDTVGVRLELAAIRVFGRGLPLNDLSDSIRSIADQELVTIVPSSAEVIADSDF